MAIVRVEKNKYTVDKLYQWDLNQVLEIYGLSFGSAPEIHFTNDDMVRAVRVFSTMDNSGVIRATVPNSLLQKPFRVIAYVCTREGEIFKSHYKIVIPVEGRNKPADYTITDDAELYSFVELENLVKDATNQVDAAIVRVNEAVNTANAAANVANGIADTANEAKTLAETANTAATNAVSVANEAKATAEDPISAKFTATLLADSWVENNGLYTQTVAVEGILSTDDPDVDIDLSGVALDLHSSITEAWGTVDMIMTADNSVTAYFFEAPTVNIHIKLKVVRK